MKFKAPASSGAFCLGRSIGGLFVIAVVMSDPRGTAQMPMSS
jgi:hypothetical protein